MQTKLTLRMEDRLIERAKIYAQKRGTSVSQLVADYFNAMEEPSPKPENELTPIVRSLKGALRGVDLHEKAYRQHLEDKYL